MGEAKCNKTQISKKWFRIQVLVPSSAKDKERSKWGESLLEKVLAWDVLAYVCACLCVVYICVYMYGHACRKLSILASYSFCSFETGFLTESEDRLAASKPQRSYCVHPNNAVVIDVYVPNMGARIWTQVRMLEQLVLLLLSYLPSS